MMHPLHNKLSREACQCESCRCGLQGHETLLELYRDLASPARLAKTDKGEASRRRSMLELLEKRNSK